MSLIHQELVLKITRFVIALTFKSVGKIYSTKTSFVEHFQGTIILRKRNLNFFGILTNFFLRMPCSLLLLSDPIRSLNSTC